MRLKRTPDSTQGSLFCLFIYLSMYVVLHCMERHARGLKHAMLVTCSIGTCMLDIKAHGHQMRRPGFLVLSCCCREAGSTGSAILAPQNITPKMFSSFELASGDNDPPPGALHHTAVA